MTFTRLSPSQRESLTQAVSRYHQQAKNSPLEPYLAGRGLDPDDITRFRLGYVADPLPEHEPYRGHMVIPYLRHHPRHGWTCVSLRYRRLDNDGPKYLTTPGDKPRLYNTRALEEPIDTVGITEGEIDAITATICGLHTVGVPGAATWKPYWSELFKGYRKVIVLADGDEPGLKLATTIASGLSNTHVIQAPPGEDINSIFTNQGKEAVQHLWT